MTFADVKRIRQNPTAEDCDNEELSKMIDVAIEKQIPKKPLKKSLANNGYAWEWTCPNCRIVKVTTEKQFCDDCGQALDWSGNNAN